MGFGRQKSGLVDVIFMGFEGLFFRLADLFTFKPRKFLKFNRPLIEVIFFPGVFDDRKCEFFLIPLREVSLPEIFFSLK